MEMKTEAMLAKTVDRLMGVVEHFVERVKEIEERLDGGASAKDRRRTEAPGSGLRSARSHLLIVK